MGINFLGVNREGAVATNHGPQVQHQPEPPTRGLWVLLLLQKHDKATNADRHIDDRRFNKAQDGARDC